MMEESRLDFRQPPPALSALAWPENLSAYAHTCKGASRCCALLQNVPTPESGRKKLQEIRIQDGAAVFAGILRVSENKPPTPTCVTIVVARFEVLKASATLATEDVITLCYVQLHQLNCHASPPSLTHGGTSRSEL